MSGSVVTLAAPASSMALQYSIEKLSAIIGPDWKRLAKALPLSANPAKTDKRISDIEKQYKNHETQAKASILEWAANAKEEPSVDDIIIALRKCSLHNMIAEVEIVASEFTA